MVIFHSFLYVYQRVSTNIYATSGNMAVLFLASQHWMRSAEAANRNMSPVFACTITEEDRASSKRTGTPAGASVNRMFFGRAALSLVFQGLW